jgi:hypothetical protein
MASGDGASVIVLSIGSQYEDREWVSGTVRKNTVREKRKAGGRGVLSHRLSEYLLYA